MPNRLKIVDTERVKLTASEEKELVEKLRERVLDILPVEETAKPEDEQEAFLLRWLRARDMNLDKSETLMRVALKWRKDHKVDQALSRELEPFIKDAYQWRFIGVDWEGRPVSVCPYYDWDFRKMLAPDKIHQFDHFLHYFFESVLKEIRICNENRKPGQAPITQFTPILDVNQFLYGQMLSIGAMRKWFQIASTYEAYYPEILHRAIFINCPSYFRLFVDMLKAFLCPHTLGKFSCYPSVEDWRKDIDKVVDPAIVPEQYGGTCKINPFDDTKHPKATEKK